MIYYLGLLFKWTAHAFVPALLLLLVGALVLVALWWFVLRPRHLSPVRAWLVLGAVVLIFGGWRTWGVWQDFSRPELRMFQEYIAEPIPREVQGLAPATAAPVMFHDGAYISFKAPQELVEGIVNHSVRGSKTLAVVEEIKRQSRRNTSDDVAIVASDGQSYRKVDLEWLTTEHSSESSWARAEVEHFLKNGKGDVYVLLRAGPWGKFASLLRYEPASSNVVILQHLERRR